MTGPAPPGVVRPVSRRRRQTRKRKRGKKSWSTCASALRSMRPRSTGYETRTCRPRQRRGGWPSTCGRCRMQVRSMWVTAWGDRRRPTYGRTCLSRKRPDESKRTRRIASSGTKFSSSSSKSPPMSWVTAPRDLGGCITLPTSTTSPRPLAPRRPAGPCRPSLERRRAQTALSVWLALLSRSCDAKARHCATRTPSFGGRLALRLPC